MKNSEIKFNILLNEENLIQTIKWNSSDKPTDGPDETDAIAISIWDPEQRNTLRIDLWSKNMNATEMKMFTVNSIGGLADTIRNSTGDHEMADEMEALCQKLMKRIENPGK